MNNDAARPRRRLARWAWLAEVVYAIVGALVAVVAVRLLFGDLQGMLPIFGFVLIFVGLPAATPRQTDDDAARGRSTARIGLLWTLAGGSMLALDAAWNLMRGAVWTAALELVVLASSAFLYIHRVRSVSGGRGDR